MNRIFWAGDSTVQFNGIETFPQTGIGQVFNLYCKSEVEIKNFAKNGRSTKSFIDEQRLVPIYDGISEGDFLFIQFGHNDEKASDPVRFTEPQGEFKVNLKKFINVARNKKATPVIITPLERRLYDDPAIPHEFCHTEYVEAAKEVALAEGVALIDLTTMSRDAMKKAGNEETATWYMHCPAGVYKYKPDGSQDNTHLQYKGAVIYAGLIAKGLKELGGIYSDLLREDVE